MSGSTNRAHQGWLVKQDTENEIIEPAETMTITTEIFLGLILLATILKALGSTLFDIYTDVDLALYYNSFESQYPNQSMAQAFPEESQSGNWDAILDEVRSFKNWYGMTSQQLFLYTLGPILLPLVFNFIEAFEFVFSKNTEQVVTKRMEFFFKLLLIICSPVLPIIVTSVEAFQTYLEKTSRNSQDILKSNEAVEIVKRLNSRVQLIEVLAEAGIQPLLQVFVILRSPSFFIFSSDWYGTTSSHFSFELSKLFFQPQFISCGFSFFTLSATYSLNYSKRLGSTMSLAAKGVHFVHVVSAVLSRITCIMWFALSYFHYNNDSLNPFSCIYLTIALHISIIMVCSILFKKCSEEELQEPQQWYKQFPVSIKNCVLDGFSTLYLPYVIEENGKMDVKRQLLAHILILVENIGMTVMAAKWAEGYLEDLMTHFLVFIWTGYGVSLLLDVLFNKFLHPDIMNQPATEKTDIEKLFSAFLKMVAQILMIIIANVVMVSCISSTDLSQTEIILWTLVPICLATGFYMIECINFIRSNDSFCGNMLLFRALIMALCPLWPIFLLILVLFCKFKTEKDSKEGELLYKFTGKAYMIVVCTLTSLPCLLQLHLLLPTLTNAYPTNFIVWASMFLWFYKAQILFIFISLGLMVCYFLSTHCHYAKMTTGCKVVYALQIMLASFSRLLLINLFALALEDGAFYFVYIVIMVHFLIVLLVHIAVDCKNHEKTQFSTIFFLRLMTSIFTNLHDQEELKKDMMKYFFMELIILMEYLAFWICIFLSLNCNYTAMLAVMWTFYWVALSLKIIFYLKLHPSSTLLIEKLKSKKFFYQFFTFIYITEFEFD